jgi:hypothetical protein
MLKEEELLGMFSWKGHKDVQRSPSYAQYPDALPWSTLHTSSAVPYSVVVVPYSKEGKGI